MLPNLSADDNLPQTGYVANRSGDVFVHRSVKGFLRIAALAILLLGVHCGQTPPTDAKPGQSSLRVPPLTADLHVLPTYRAGKTSAVMGLETRAGLERHVATGQRQTLLSVEGQGSVRHIWQTEKWPTCVLEITVDGEATPSIVGTMKQLTEAALRCSPSLIAPAAAQVPKESYNLYLPIPFSRSIRIDAVVSPELSPPRLSLSFFQIDYRLDDPSLAGARLRQEGQGDALRLRYEGTIPVPPTAAEIAVTRVTLVPGPKGEADVAGPGIIREFKVVPPVGRLQVLFDDAVTPAIDVETADFTGPFTLPLLDAGVARFPMPFARKAVFRLADNSQGQIEISIETVPEMKSAWGYFHARSNRAAAWPGAAPYPVLHVRGSGNWLGMALYNTGHDHGGGDFAVIDEQSSSPGFLHGINGEDYFGFAWFGKGLNAPFSHAVNNIAGRVRFHLENSYPFHQSIQVNWGVLEGQSPRSVAYWYQDSPEDTSVPANEPSAWEWEVFGPVDAPLAADGYSPDTSSAETLFRNLPIEQSLDSGQAVPMVHRYHKEYPGSFQGWARQRAEGGHLNLTYVYRHALRLADNGHLATYPRCMMARRSLASETARTARFQLSYDDPIEVLVNRQRAYLDLEIHNGFITRSFDINLQAGENKILVRLADTPNVDTGWAGFSLSEALPAQPPAAGGVTVTADSGLG